MKYPNLRALFGAAMDNLFRNRSSSQRSQLDLAEQKFTELQNMVDENQAKAEKIAELELAESTLQATLSKLHKDRNILRADISELKKKLQHGDGADLAISIARTHMTSIDEEASRIIKAAQLTNGEASTGIDVELSQLKKNSTIHASDQCQTSVDDEITQLRNVRRLK